MPAINRVFPPSYLAPTNCFSLLFLSEGFKDPDLYKFHVAVSDFIEQLQNFTPFNVTRFLPSWIAIYTPALPSTEEGPKFAATPGNTVFKSTYDPTTHALAVDSTAVQSTVVGLDIQGEAEDPNSPGVWSNVSGRWGLTGALVVVLTPALTTQGGAVSGELDFTPTIPPTPGQGTIPFIATSIDGQWHQVVLRKIGELLGLGPEDSLPGPNFAAPDLATAVGLDTYPNLAVFINRSGSTRSIGAPPAEPPQAAFKWFALLPAAQRSSALRVVPHPGPPDQPDYSLPAKKTVGRIALYEGGGGYRTKVYRSAHDCLMRRRIGDRNLSIKSQYVPFCPVCEQHVRSRLDGIKFAPTKRARMATQTLRYDDVTWTNKATLSQLPRALTRISAVAGITDPYWEFDYEVDRARGLRIYEAGILLPAFGSTPASRDELASLIEFLDIVVTFEDGSKHPFVFQDAIDSGNAVLEVADGSLGADKRYQHGLKLTLTNKVAGLAEVRVEMSVVFRGKYNDFDPGGVVEAAKVYPQLGLTWSSGAKKKVTAMSGRVLIVLNNHRAMAGHAGHHAGNIINVFTDSNTSFTDVRRSQHPIRWFTPMGSFKTKPFPNWHLVFDYARVDLQKEIEFTAVAGPADAARYKIRGPQSYTWPSGTTDSLKPVKTARQGAYDNVHCHAYMDDDANTPGKPLVHAPGCGEACFHFHWRWADLAATNAAAHIGSAPFKGWAADLSGAVAGSVAAAPLVPPNQHVRVAITHYMTPGNASGGDIVGAGTVAAGTKALDPLARGVWYSVEASKLERRPGERQVFLEQGLGIAFDYASTGPSVDLQNAVLDAWNDSWSLTGMAVEPQKVWPASFYPNKFPSGPSTSMEKFHALYQWIRWFNDLSPAEPQIPQGDYAGGAATSIEEL